MIEPNEIYKIVEKECKKKKISQQKLLSDIGLAKSTLDNMKKGSMPSVDKVSAIAEYLGVPIEYLLGRSEPLRPASESEWLSVLDQMSDEDLKSMKSYAQYLISKQSTENKDLEKALSERVKDNGIQEE